MNGNWEGITNLVGTVIPLSSPPILAQGIWQDVWTDITSIVGADFGTSVLNFVKAVLIFVLIWVIASFVSKFILTILRKTDIDNKIASWIGGGQGNSIPIEQWIANVVYWLIFLFGVVAFFNTLDLPAVSGPLNELLEQVTSFFPRIISAGIWLTVAWVVATIVKTLVSSLLNAFRLDERLGPTGGAGQQLTVTNTIASALYWFVFLFFLMPILEALALQNTLAPVQALINEITTALPNVLKAAIVGAVGWFVANLVRRIATNLLAATGINQLGARLGLSRTGNNQSLAEIAGNIIYALILIPVAIATLRELQVDAISDPAIAMLDQVLNFVPKIFSAGVILAFFYFLGKFVAELVTSILSSIGFDNIAEWLGLPFLGGGSASSPEGYKPDSGQETVLQSAGPLPAKTPSEFLGTLVIVAFSLVGILTAVDILQIEALASVVGIILVIAGQVLLGLVVLAIGLFLANLAFRLITSGGGRQSNILAQVARIAIIGLVSAMALQVIGVAPNIVNLAFGLLLGAIAGAILLAFGLGSRDIAGEQVREWLDSFKKGG